MPQLSPEKTPPTVYAEPWAVRFGFLLVIGLTLIVGLSFFDNARRPQLETASETTSVGDTHFFVLPEPEKLPVVGAMLDGKPLYVAAKKPFDLKDTHTKRVGQDAERGLTIYTLAETALPAEREKVGRKDGVRLLKTAVNQYVIADPAGGK
jgi:hypothetical protein